MRTGRPRIPFDRQMAATLHLRLTREELRIIGKAYRLTKKGMHGFHLNMSEWARTALTVSAKRQVLRAANRGAIK